MRRTAKTRGYHFSARARATTARLSLSLSFSFPPDERINRAAPLYRSNNYALLTCAIAMPMLVCEFRALNSAPQTVHYFPRDRVRDIYDAISTSSRATTRYSSSSREILRPLIKWILPANASSDFSLFRNTRNARIASISQCHLAVYFLDSKRASLSDY